MPWPTTDAFWATLAAPDVMSAVLALEPASHVVELDDDYLDDIAAAFGQVVDSKSPYTSGHSARVALYTDLIAETLGLAPERRRWLKRGALLHDVGKLGVSNSVLDKPGKLDAEEWAAIQARRLYRGPSLIPHRCLCRTGGRFRRPPRAAGRQRAIRAA